MPAKAAKALSVSSVGTCVFDTRRMCAHSAHNALPCWAKRTVLAHVHTWLERFCGLQTWSRDTILSLTAEDPVEVDSLWNPLPLSVQSPANVSLVPKA